jgi:hypothetical protein
MQWMRITPNPGHAGKDDEMSNPTKVYLGDGVYGDVQDGCIVLTTENGISVTNTIVLEYETLASLETWLKRLRDCR